MKSKPWSMPKSLVTGMPWSPAKTAGSVQVLDPRPIRVIPQEPSKNVSRGTDLPVDHPSDVRGQGHPQSGFRSRIKNLLANAVISPSFLLSSLVVFLFVPDTVLKGRYSVDIRARASEAMRRSIDIGMAGILVLLLSPLFLIIPILIKLDSPGSIIYRQLRVGQNRRKDHRRRNAYRLRGDRRNGDRRQENHFGKLFVLYKFRSMREDAEKKSGPVWAQKGDPRVTKVGKLLRATRTDELPQLINILKGDMSIVGPRPERPFFVNQFVSSIERYDDRLRVKPGLTGLAQVMGGYDTCLDDVYSKLNYDLNYIAQRSLGQDAKILLRTIGVVISGKGVYE